MTVDLAAAYRKVQAAVGQTSRVELGEVRARDFQRFAISCGDDNPLYFDEDVARAHGLPGVVAPPVFLSGVMGWGSGPPNDELREDGSAAEQIAHLPLEGLRLMGAGQELTFHEPVVDGLQVVMDVVVEDVDHKQGRSGELLIITLLRTYRRADGETLIECRERFIGR